MRIVTISDTHTQHWSVKIPDEGDIIIHAGDLSYQGTEDEIETFLKWYSDLDYGIKILVAGNHDWGFEKEPEYFEQMCKDYGITYLNDSSITYQGIKIWGSPVQPEFFDWAFNRSIKKDMYPYHSRNKFIGPHWDKIPEDVDILITHGPPYGILDETRAGDKVGCKILLEKVEKIRPAMHIFGHIHEVRGVQVSGEGKMPITYVNASSVDARYRPWSRRGHEEFVFEWDRVLTGQSRGNDLK